MLLAPSDRARAVRRRTESGRRRTVIGRALLRLLAGGILGIEPREVATGTSPQGAPRAGGPAGRRAGEGGAESLAVSVAHTAGLVVVAGSSSARRVGVDVERLDRRTRPEAIARRHFLPSEAAELTTLPRVRRRAAFLRAWTLKEAWGKAAGVAVPAALSRIGFSIRELGDLLPPPSPSASIYPHSARWPGDGPTDRGWHFWTTASGTHTLGVAALFGAGAEAGKTSVRIRSGEARLRCPDLAVRT